MMRKSGIAKPNCPNLEQAELTTYDPTTQPFDEPLRHVDTQSRITDKYTQSRIAVAPLDFICKEEPRLATWGDVFWAWVIKGMPREEAAFRADEWERRIERERSGFSGRLNRAMRRKMAKETKQ
jgi:hypothetical protein